jgi:hypothetical protein
MASCVLIERTRVVQLRLNTMRSPVQVSLQHREPEAAQAITSRLCLIGCPAHPATSRVRSEEMRLRPGAVVSPAPQRDSVEHRPPGAPVAKVPRSTQPLAS